MLCNQKEMVIIGVKRCGKSALFKMFADKLLAQGIEEHNRERILRGCVKKLY